MNTPLLRRALLSSIIVMLCLFARVPSAHAQQPIGQFDGQTDVGAVEAPGAAVYDAEAQEYVLESTGASVEDGEDTIYFVWKRVGGDFILRTHAAFQSDEGNAPRTLGWMVRSSLDPGAAHVRAAVRADGRTALEAQPVDGDSTRGQVSPVRGADVIQLAREGDSFILSVAQHGDPFAPSQQVDLALGDSVYVGLFVGAEAAGAARRAAFHNVRIVKPAADDLVPYENYLGSNLEVVHVESGRRRIVHRSSEPLQAPNWTPDDEALIYNSNGLLYRFDLDTEAIDVIDTGFADQNNNDHVLSFDGTQIGISHQSEKHDGQSIIYTLPIEGGTPTQVTPTGPSYLHGWSPDGNWLTYTGRRDGAYDIYKIPATGGNEVRLTDAEGLDDGSEYSPDGEYIYFNSVRSGSMEIWRMRPDGSEKEQLTDDRLNNWFPHIAPDGETIVFLSYLPAVPPGDHPYYKQVYLRRMPVDGGEPEVIAYLYGGQGTINVPSWSPDSEHVAFVSNTGR